MRTIIGFVITAVVIHVISAQDAGTNYTISAESNSTTPDAGLNSAISADLNADAQNAGNQTAYSSGFSDGAVPMGTALDFYSALPANQVTDDEMMVSGQASATLLKSDWGSFLVPAPTAVWALGELNLLSSRKGVPDFALQQPRDGYKYLRHPKSFRGSLVQLANDGAEAFHTATDNMRNIAATMGILPGFWQQAINVAKKRPAPVVKAQVTMFMKRIAENTDKCVQWANDTSTAFVNVRLLMAELLETSTATEGSTREALRAAQNQIAANKQDEERLKSQLAQVERVRNDTEKNVKELQKSYNDAVRAIPTGWDIIGQQIVKSLANTAIQLANTAAGVAIMMKGGIGAGVLMGANQLNNGGGNGATTTPASGTGGQTGGSTAGNFPADLDRQQVLTVYTKAEEQLTALQKIAIRLFTATTETDSTSPNQLIVTVLSAIKQYKSLINQYAKGVEKTSATQVFQEAEDVAEQMNQLTKTLTKLSELKTGNQDKVDKLNSITARLRQLNVASQMAANGQKIEMKAPDPVTYQGEGGLEKYKADMLNQRLDKAEEDRKYYLEKQMKLQDDLARTMTNLADMSKKEINFQAIANCIVEAMKIISTIQESWSRLSIFFKKISTDVGTFSESYVKSAVDQIGTEFQFDVQGSAREGVLDVLTENQIGFVRESSALKTIATTYQEISERYVLKQLSGISGLMTISDPKEQEVARVKLERESRTASAAIENLVNDQIAKAKDEIRSQLENVKKDQATVAA